MNGTELATVLAALRHYQKNGATDIETEFGTVLDDQAIDELCERLNTEPTAAPAALNKGVSQALQLAIARAESELGRWPEADIDNSEHRSLRTALGRYQRSFDLLKGGAS